MTRDVLGTVFIAERGYLKAVPNIDTSDFDFK